MMRTVVPAALGAILTMSLGIHSASADPTADDKAAAEALFEEGLALVEKGEIAAACERFAESQRRDPQLGTLLYLATCHEQQGKTATAWVEFKDALGQAEQARNAARIDQAKQGVTRVEAVLARVRLKVAAPAPAQKITINGREIRTFDTALPYDPGELVIEAEAPDRVKSQTKVMLAPGPGTTEVEIAELAIAELAIGKKPDGPAEKPEPERDRTLAYIVGGAGLGVVALGLAFGGVAMSEQSSADDECDGRFCTQEGLDGHDRADAWAWASNVSIGVGVAAVGTGVLLFFLAPEVEASPSAASAQVPILITNVSDREMTMGLAGVW